MLGYSTRKLRLCSSTQSTRKFIKALTIKDYEFLFNESSRRALIASIYSLFNAELRVIVLILRFNALTSRLHVVRLKLNTLTSRLNVSTLRVNILILTTKDV
ncbi:hypothetical protein DSM107007_36030 [Nostoc sp. PCC 7120 = FACHB-418]|nr:hypothetical protein DSM107007_36030 [Nostoc sp. PCC 7120 = FACHB-418]